MVTYRLQPYRFQHVTNSRQLYKNGRINYSITVHLAFAVDFVKVPLFKSLSL